MRIKKLALFVIVIAVLGAAAIYANANEDKFALLTALGIIDADADRTQILTRGDAAEMLSVFIDIPAEKATELFSDVTPEDESVAAVAGAKIMNGYGNRIFGINDPVSREQFTKAVVSMLGYGAVAEKRGGYPSGYTDTARQLGLLDGITAEAESALNLEQAVCIVYNSLEVGMLVPDGFNTDKFAVDSDKTLLKDILKVEHTVGKVTANSETALSAGGKDAGEGKIRINDIMYKAGKSFDAFLGYNVKCYYREEDGDMYIVYMCAKDSNELTLDAADIKSADFRKITYETEGRKKSAAISAAADFIKNGKSAVFSDAKDIVPEYGGVKLLDSDNDGEYDTVFIDSVIIRQASGADPDGETILVKRRFEAINLTSAERVLIIKNGEEIKAEDIQKDDILCIRADKELTLNGVKTVAPNAEIIKITVVNKKVNGTVKELDYSDENKGFIVLDKKKYRITPYLKVLMDSGKSDKLRIGQTADIWLDEFGNAAEFFSQENEEQYAYLLNAVYSYDDEIGKIRVINFYNEEEEYMLAEEFTLDGQRKSEVPDLISALSENGEVKTQLIYFTTNEKREVNKVDTLRLNTQYETVRNSLIKSVPKQSYKYYYRSTGRNLGGKMIVDDNATVFVAPLNQNSREAKDYAVYGASYFQNNNYYYADGYNFNDAETCKLFVAYYDKTQIEDTVGVAVVDKIIDTVNYDNELVKELYLYDGTGYGAFETASMDVEFINSTKTENLTLDNLKKGDVIRYITDRYGAIITIELCHDADGENKIGTNGTFTSTFRTTYGIAYDVGDSVLKIVYSDTGDTSTAELISLNSCMILKYDKECNKLEEINSSEIVPFLSCNSYMTASRIFTYANKGSTSIVVVY